MDSSGVRQRKQDSGTAQEGDSGPQRRQKKLKKQSPSQGIFGLLAKILRISFIVILGLIIVLLLLPSPIEPKAYTLPPPRPMTGVLAPNTRLQKATRLLEGQIVGPESMAYRNGRIYTGTHDGKVVEITNDKEIKVIAQLGTPPCGPREDEVHCGRPLGLRFVDDKLVVIDAYFGLYELDITGKSLPVELLSTQRSYKGHSMKMANDFEVLENGDYMVTDSSYKWHRKDYGMIVLENGGCGRLVWYNPVSQMSDLSLENLHFANGLQLSPDKDFLLVVESTMYRILKYYVKGPKMGEVEIFIDNLPGVPDNIRPSRNGGYWVGCALSNLRGGTVSADLLGPLPWLRKLVAKVVDPTAHFSHHPPYGLILELNQKGEIVQSLHDPSGKIVGSVSEILDTGDALYLGSYHAPYLLKLEM